MAVKTLKEGSKEEDRVKFLQEAAIMAQFKHTNVVEMYGVITLGELVITSYSCVASKLSLISIYCRHSLFLSCSQRET